MTYIAGLIRSLISVKHHIHTIRQIIGIESHSLDVLVIVHKDSDLCIMALAKIKILHAAPNLYGAILLNARMTVRRNIVTIADHQAGRIHGCGIFKLPFKPFRAIVIISCLPEPDSNSIGVKLV